MADDARISTALPRHPKTVKLQRRLGVSGCWHLVCLFLWVAENRYDGDLKDMTDEDIEIAAGWTGDIGAFTRTLIEVGFIEGDERSRSIHDWAEHNPWAAQRGKRIEAAKIAAGIRWGCKQDANGMRGECEAHESAMLTTQPNPTIKPSSKPDTGFDDAFAQMFAYYLGRTNRDPKLYEFTAKRKQKGAARLKECLRKTGGDLENAKSLMKDAIDGLVASDFHMGNNPQRRKYCE